MRKTVSSVVGGTLCLITVGLIITFSIVFQMLRRMRRTWNSKLELEERVHQVETLLSNMYPKRVAEQMLHKDVRIVELLPEITCIMADIHHFTYLTNRLSPEELIDLLGYVFGCMDACADEFGIYKVSPSYHSAQVKTIGDCYMGLGGLPELPASKDHCSAAAAFCSSVIQLFSDAFLHPEAGKILQRATELKATDRSSIAPRQPQAGKMPGSQSGSDNESLRQRSIQAGSSQAASQEVKRTFCIRFGLAAGPTTIGVLRGMRTIFDELWSREDANV